MAPVTVDTTTVTDAAAKAATDALELDEKGKKDRPSSKDPKVKAALEALRGKNADKLGRATTAFDTSQSAARAFESSDAKNAARVANTAVSNPGMRTGQMVGNVVSQMAPVAMNAMASAPTLASTAAAPIAASAPSGYAVTPQQLAALAAASEGTGTGTDTSSLSSGAGKGKFGEMVKNLVAAKIPYAWGGGTLEGPSKGISDGGGAADANGDYNKVGFDCSGLSRWMRHEMTGEELPRTSQAQYSATQPVADPQPGDLVFPASSGTPPTHVQVYIGDGKVIHAPQSGDVVKIDNVTPGSRFHR